MALIDQVTAEVLTDRLTPAVDYWSLCLIPYGIIRLTDQCFRYIDVSELGRLTFRLRTISRART